MMKTLAASLIVTTCAALTMPAHGAGQAEANIVGTWQFGLTPSVRHMDAKLAYKTGTTGAVLTLKSDKTTSMGPPCRDQNFIKQFGIDALTGTWELTKDDLLVLSFRHADEKMVETYSVKVSGDDMTLTAEGKKPRRLGRFNGDISAGCE